MSESAGYDTALEQLLVAAASGRPGASQDFERELLAATVHVAGWERADGSFSPLQIEGPEGPVLPLFTSEARVRESWPYVTAGLGPGASYGDAHLRVREAPARTVLEGVLRSSHAGVLNPHSGYGKVLTMAEMSRLLGGVSVEIGAGTRLEVGAPARVPAGLPEALRAHLLALGPGQVATARLAWVRYPDGLSGYLLEVMTELPRERVLAGVDGLVPLLGNVTLDVLVVAPDRPSIAGDVAALLP